MPPHDESMTLRRARSAALVLGVAASAAVATGALASVTTASTARVQVFFPRGTVGRDCGRVHSRYRRVRAPAVLRGALAELLRGPTAAERRLGYGGWFSGKTAGRLNSVRLSGGVARVDFRDFRRIIPNASTSCGSAMLLAQLDRTVLQFPNVHRVVYSFGGSVKRFYEWLQLSPPHVASAQARLVYERGFRTPHPAIWIAHDDGTSATRLAYGISPLISPNGRLVAYLSTPPTGKARLMLIPATGGGPRGLLSASLLFTVSWSPDSKRIAVAEQTPATRPSQRTQQIVTIDVTTGGIHAISRASLPYSMSFAPSGSQLAYTSSASADPIRDNIYRAPATGGRAVRLTHDGHSMSPLWGPNWIAFVRETPGTRTDPIPKMNLYLVRPNGTGLHRLTREPIAKEMFGFTPIAWSDNGRRLIAQFAGPGISYVVTIDPRTGAVHRVGQDAPGGVIRGAALSRDGTTILGVQEGARGLEHVVTLPYGGGKAHVLARNAIGPSWSR